MQMQPAQFEGFVRTTHKYRTGWRHLERRRYVGDFRLLKYKPVDRPGVEWEDAAVLITVRAPRNVHDRETIYEVLSNEFDAGCTHEWDCCGCFHGGPSWTTLRHTKKREWSCLLTYARNY